MHSIKHNRLEAAVLFAIQNQVHLAVSYSDMITRINSAPVKKSQSKGICAGCPSGKRSMICVHSSAVTGRLSFFRVGTTPLARDRDNLIIDAGLY